MKNGGVYMQGNSFSGLWSLLANATMTVVKVAGAPVTAVKKIVKK